MTATTAPARANANPFPFPTEGATASPDPSGAQLLSDLVDNGAGSRRHARALYWMGWRITHIADYLGVPRTTLQPGGQFTYVPAADFNGVDSFTYTVNDGQGGSASQTVATAAGIKLKPVSQEQSVTDVLGKVTAGEADAGLVYVTDVRAAGQSVQGIAFPEATRAVIEREAPGIPEAMRLAGLKNTPRAMLSRAAAGIRGRTLIINLPGSPRGVEESLGAILEALPHAIETVKGEGGDCASHR